MNWRDRAEGRQLRTLLTVVAALLSFGVFAGLILQSYEQAYHYENRIAERLVGDLASSIGELAYDDPALWPYQVDRMASKVESLLRNEPPDERAWSVSVLSNEGEVLFQQQADFSVFEVTASRPVGLGF